MFGSPSTAAFIADRAPAHLRGRYQSSLGLTYALAFTIGPIGGTAIYGWWPDGPLDRLRSIGCDRSGTGPRRRAVPRAHPRRTAPQVDASPPVGYISKPIYRADISARYDEGDTEDARTRGPGPAQGATHARLPALPGARRLARAASGGSPTARCTRPCGAWSSDGAIESEAGDERGARRKKVYRITPKGEQIFLELLQEPPHDTQTRGRPVPDAPRVLPVPAARDPHPPVGAAPPGARRNGSPPSRSRSAQVAGAPTTTVAR